MELKDTVALMESNDYKERFRGEYYQTKIRKEKLDVMLKKWDDGALEFTPTCPREMYDKQIAGMSAYLNVLEQRAVIENVEL